MWETWVDGTSAEVQSLDLSDLEPGTYFWRVSALDADGYESAWSNTAHFIYPSERRTSVCREGLGYVLKCAPST